MSLEIEPQSNVITEDVRRVKKNGHVVENWEFFSQSVSYRGADYDLDRIVPETLVGIYKLSAESPVTGAEAEFIMIDKDGIVVKEGAKYYETDQDVR